MTTDARVIKQWAEMEMREYDRLPPEMRAAVQEYGELPWDAYQPVEEYVALQEQYRQARQNLRLTVLDEPVTA